mmetsp:Transcript_25989/g.47789  ORF Transcript_25989/g.47789 Transcript_25989/m.47789 type:complete len:202 (-) Transcript_25989:175-780(-)
MQVECPPFPGLMHRDFLHNNLKIQTQVRVRSLGNDISGSTHDGVARMLPCAVACPPECIRAECRILQARALCTASLPRHEFGFLVPRDDAFQLAVDDPISAVFQRNQQCYPQVRCLMTTLQYYELLGSPFRATLWLHHIYSEPGIELPERSARERTILRPKRHQSYHSEPRQDNGSVFFRPLGSGRARIDKPRALSLAPSF